MYSSAYVWAKVLNYLEQQLTPTVVATWFDDAEILELTDSRLTVLSPSDFRRETIQRRWIPYIQDAMQVLFDMNVEVVLLGEEERRRMSERAAHPDFIVNNPQFTFKSFVVGPSNRFAHGAALAVANRPADAYNPLFIYGQSGLGKTHLLYAIAAEIHARHPEFNIVYIRGDQFTNEMIAALREGRNMEFRTKYRNADLFLVDDIPCNANGKIDIYRITRDRLRGEAWNIVPVREAGRLTDILAEPAGQADSITGGSLPEGMEGRSALGIYELFNTAPEQRQKGSPASSVGLWRSKYAEHMAMLIKMLFQNKGKD